MSKKDYYELLDLEPDATEREIEEAYDKIKKIYSDDSIATHSLFSRDERKAIFEKATMAYTSLKAHKLNVINSRNENISEQTGDVKIRSEPKDGRQPNFEVNLEYGLKSNEVKIKKPLVALSHPESFAAEQYRFLCTRVEQLSGKKNDKVFAITSAVKGEGKTTTTINMAYVLAHEFKRKVLLIDGDLRNPSLPTFFELNKGCNLADILTGDMDPAYVVDHLFDKNLTFLKAASAARSNASELLSSPNMRRFINSFKKEFDHILIDSPPVLPVADMNILSEVVDGILFVVQAEKTPKDLVLKALKANFSTEVVGIILNDAKNSIKKYSYYYKY